MKNLLALVIIFHVVHSAAFSQGKGSKDLLDLDKVISSINNSLAIAQGKLSDVELMEGSVTLQTTYDKSGGGGFKLFVKAEKKWTKESSSSVTYTYTKPQEKRVTELISDQLAEIIIKAAEQYKSSKTITGLSKDGFEVKVSLSITNVTSTGLEFELFGVGIDASADLEKKVFHSITLSFK